MNRKMNWMARCWALGALLIGGVGAAQNVAHAQPVDEMAVGNQSMNGMRTRNADMLIQTLSEEKTEINSLAAQQAMFKKMGGRENRRLASLWGRMIREHKAAAPGLMRLIRANGGDPMQAKVLKAPPLGDKPKMIHATHVAHEMAVRTSQMRHGMTDSNAVKNAMRKRANLARKHIRLMEPYHEMAMGGNSMNGQKVAMMCPHCNVAMKNGACPMCKMTAAQMKKM